MAGRPPPAQGLDPGHAPPQPSVAGEAVRHAPARVTQRAQRDPAQPLPKLRQRARTATVPTRQVAYGGRSPIIIFRGPGLNLTEPPVEAPLTHTASTRHGCRSRPGRRGSGSWRRGRGRRAERERGRRADSWQGRALPTVPRVKIHVPWACYAKEGGGSRKTGKRGVSCSVLGVGGREGRGSRVEANTFGGRVLGVRWWVLGAEETREGEGFPIADWGSWVF